LEILVVIIGTLRINTISRPCTDS